MGKKRCFLGFLVSLFLFIFATNAADAAYSCQLTYTSCNAGYALQGGQCNKCSAGTFSAAGATTCTPCSAGTFSDAGASSCTPCSAGTFSDAGASECISNTVTVSFNLNGGTGIAPADASCTPGSNYCTILTSNELTGNTNAFYRNGYVFDGWYTAATGGTKLSTTNPTIQSATTYYAHWNVCSDGTYKADGANANATCDTCPTKYYCSGGTEKPCPSLYPNSGEGSTKITDCYATKNASCTQITCSTPAGCSSAKCTACTCNASTYEQHTNSTGTGNGAIVGDAEVSCYKTVASVSASSGYYVSESRKECLACEPHTYYGTSNTNTSTCADGTTSIEHATNTTQSYTTTCSTTSNGGYVYSCTDYSCSTIYNNCRATRCEAGYVVNNGLCKPAAYTVTYSCGTGASGNPPASTTATFGSSFTPAANTCTKANANFIGWKVGETGLVWQPDEPYEWTLTTGQTLTAKWLSNCSSSQYFDGNSCQPCPSEYPLSESGATSIDECYNNTCTTDCLTPAQPNNSVGYMYNGKNGIGTLDKVTGIQYHGGTCTTNKTCPYTDITCDRGYYLDKEIWTNTGGIWSTPSTQTNINGACKACSDLSSIYNTSAANSLSIGGGGPEMCLTTVNKTCSELLPKPNNSGYCTYEDYNGQEITEATRYAYYPDGANLQPTTTWDGVTPKGCYVTSCSCNPGYKYEQPTEHNITDPGSCVPDVFAITLNDNCGIDGCQTSGDGTIYQKYSIGWYATSANASSETNAITSVTKPTRTDYVFLGYFDDAVNGNKIISENGTLTGSPNFTMDTTLYAHWSVDDFTCTAGKTHDGNTCPVGSYCPGGPVSDSLKADTTYGCARTCPNDTGAGTVTSPSGSTLITQCKTTRTNVPLSDNTGRGNQTCFYDVDAGNYSNSCTIVITSCNVGRYREAEASITCAVVGKGAYSPADDMERHMCSALSGADTTVTTEGDTSAAATACYNTCSDISITNGSRKTVNEKEYYNGTSIPACSYTTQCNTGYHPNGETCIPNIYEVVLNHNGGSSSVNNVYLKYANGWYATIANAEAGTNMISTITMPTWPGKSCSGYFSATDQQIVDATGKLTTNHTVFSSNNGASFTVTASWELKPVINCVAGTYYTGTGTTCTDCPAGSYCVGTSPIQDTGTVSGLEQCPSGAYTAAVDVNDNPLTVTVSSNAKSTKISDCYATNVAYTATQGAGKQTCYYNSATGKYASSCTDITVLTCTTGHWLAPTNTTDCAEVTAGWYSPNKSLTRSECPNRNEDSTITTQGTTSGAITQCYRGNIWYEPAGGHSGHRRNCYHKPDATDTNISTGYTYNCDVSVIVTCDAGYYDDGSYTNTNNERDCTPVGKGAYSPAQSAFVSNGEALQPNMDTPGSSIQRYECPIGVGATDVVSTTPDTATTTSGLITDCYLTCNATKNLNGTIVDVINSPVHFNITKDAYDKCTYDSNECPADMWCDPDGFHDCPIDKDGTLGKADFVAGQKYRGIDTCYVVYDPYHTTAGYPNHNWEHGTGWAKCFFNGAAATGDYNNCMDVDAYTCEAGYYYKTAGAFACSGTQSGYYSGADAVNQTECPVGWAGSTSFAPSYTACYKECNLSTADIPHSVTVSAAENTVYGISTTAYKACSYNITCNTGYDVKNNNTASPSCAPHEYTIMLDKNGGTGSTPTSVNCTFDSGACALPAIVDTRTGYTSGGKWCTAADGSGTCYNAGTTITTNISANATTITLYALWTPNVYTIVLNHNGATTNGAPGTVYLKYATGWYSNATASNPISALTTKPVKGVLTFAGYTGNGVTIIGSDGKLSTSQSALTFTSSNTTITAQWTDAPITCPATTYYVGTGENPATACVTCDANHYCPGVTVVTNSGQSGIEPCPDGGKSDAGSSSVSACYKELLPTYVATHGKGTQTCYYNENTFVYSENCKDFAITTCDAGYYRKNTSDADCSATEVGYYSGDMEINRHLCPNGGTTNGTAKAFVQDCYKVLLPYAALDGSGSGTQSCWYSSGDGASAVYGRDCFDKVITACRGGYYLANQTDIVCTPVGFDYYSADQEIQRHVCPDNGKTSYIDTSTISECWKNGQPYVAEHGGGERTCKWSVADNAYLAGCGTPTMLYCDGGYWLANGTDIECSPVGYSYYSPHPDLVKHACPAGQTTTTTTSDGAEDCFLCPANNVCEPGQEAKTCSELTNGQYPFSEPGTTNVAYCYKDCASETNATNITGHDYYTAEDTCEIASCDEGYMLSGSECVICPAGSFCDGTPGDDGDGAKSCADLGDGSWAYSAPGSTKASDCYRLCTSELVDGCTLTPIEDKAYWANNCGYTGISATGNPAEIVNGACIETSCNYNYEMVNGVCEQCNRANALSYKTGGNCIVESCEIDYHPTGADACENDVRDCTSQAPNATYAEQRWDATHRAFGICTIKSCEDDYHLASNACVANEQVCNIPNGVGTRTWNTTTKTWNPCVATSCIPGYTDDPYEKNNAAEQCSECRNKFSVLGEVAVSSYVSGCEIASCMYQGEKYNLDNNECVPICAPGATKTNPYRDETGIMYWDDARKKCIRDCDDGYVSW